MAKSILLSAVLFQGPQSNLQTNESKTMDRVRPSLVVILDGMAQKGMAACIHEDGYFIVHRSAVNFPVLFGRNTAGALIEMELVTFDEPTQLALIKIKKSGVARQFEPVRWSKTNLESNQPLLAVLTTGSVRAHLVNPELAGVVNPSRRVFPMSEIRFETTQQRVGGALVFNTSGELVGVVGATLSTSSTPGSARVESDSTANNTKALENSQNKFAVSNYGPGGLTVAYSVAPNIISRVIAGFLSPTRKASHPAIGIFCRDDEKGGARVDSVVKNSPAEASGIKAGDVIIEINGNAINNQFDFARVMQSYSVGMQIEVIVRRKKEVIQLKVAVGKNAD